MWLELDDKWKRRLLSDKFVEHDCLGDGNCQFRSIEEALSNAGYPVSHTKLRSAVGKVIKTLSNEEFKMIIQSYRLEKDNGEFVGDWDPYSVRTKTDFKKQISKDGFHFQGDFTTLSLLSRALGVDFVVFDSYNVIDLGNNKKYNKKIVILLRESQTHYKTVGLKNGGGVVTLFDRDPMIKELDNILDKTKYWVESVRKVCDRCQGITLNSIVQGVQQNLGRNLGIEEKREFLKVLNLYLENERFFWS